MISATISGPRGAARETAVLAARIAAATSAVKAAVLNRREDRGRYFGPARR
jgi:hypothetical protein